MSDDTLEFADEEEDELEFCDEEDGESGEPGEGSSSGASSKKWKLMIVDDDADVVQVTQFALKNFEFENKELEFVVANSGAEAKELIKEHPDTAVMLLDVVMEDDHAGLEVAKFVRNEANNQDTRIILRTGQPGLAPEKEVIINYDINDYKAKSELTSQKLFTTMISGLRAYKGIIALEKARDDLASLVDGLIRYSAAIIDDRSKHTGGHSRRVAQFTFALAEEVNNCQDIESLKDVSFNQKEMRELWMSAWLHDIGKIGVPEIVLDKEYKLSCIYNKMTEIKYRMALHKCYALIERLKDEVPADRLNHVMTETDADLTKLEEAAEFLDKVNRAEEFMTDEKLAQLEDIATWNQNSKNPDSGKIITEEEFHHLAVRKGNLTEEEREAMSSHAIITKKVLDSIDFPEDFKGVQEYAHLHHEKLNGSGYPYGLKGDEIPIQAQILALVDIYDALTAEDRPYKKPYPPEKALQILGFEVKDGNLNPDLYALFKDKKVYENVEQRADKGRTLFNTK